MLSIIEIFIDFEKIFFKNASASNFFARDEAEKQRYKIDCIILEYLILEFQLVRIWNKSIASFDILK